MPGVIPAAELVIRLQSVGRVEVRHIADLADDQGMVVEPERRPIAVADLRIANPRRRRIGVVDGADHVPLVAGPPARPDKRARERIAGPPGGQSGGGESRRAKAGIQEQRTMRADHEFVIALLWPQADRYPPREPLIEPERVQLDARRRLDVADELVVADQASARTVPVNVDAAGVEARALPAHRLFEIDIQSGRRQAVIACATLAAD